MITNKEEYISKLNILLQVRRHYNVNFSFITKACLGLDIIDFKRKGKYFIMKLK